MKKRTVFGLLGKFATIALILATLFMMLCVSLPSTASTETLERTDLLDDLMDYATSYVVVYHKQLGGSHYAYTEGLAEEYNSDNTYSEGNESVFNPGSKMTLVTLAYEDGKVTKTESQLLKCNSGVIRDPDVSSDGTKIVFSMKTSSTDDYHLYIYDLTTGTYTQITYGNGVADIEPVWCSDGSIVFNSTRDIQTVDCWYTPVSNLYKCNSDGSDIVRLGYDQVHTTYPTTTEDGRILYTRWDYNDRNQMYVQAIFQMFPDGTNQTEVFGNDLNSPTSFIHTREIPGSSGKYVSIVCGHHQKQLGKLVVIDTNEGRNDSSAITYIWPDEYTRALRSASSNDTGYYQEGRVYKYPYAISETEFIVSTAESYSGIDTKFNIELINTKGESIVLAKGSSSFPASQCVPVKTTDIFSRDSLVNYSKDYGTYYVGDVYDGQSITRGTVKYLRVVGLEFRSSAIGATNGSGTGTSDPYSPISTGNGSWDVKEVLGLATVYEDGSAMFTVPSGIPVYFQLLDENGDVVQTMRSWSTLQPGEYFSCVGCHQDKNMAPSASSTVTQAMAHGVESLFADLWMSVDDEYTDYDPYTDDPIGFDYLSVVQPILNNSCVTCHSDSATAYKQTGSDKLTCDDLTAANYIFETRSDWYYTTESIAGWQTVDLDDSWTHDYGPFGTIGTAPGAINTVWKTGTLYLRKTINLSYQNLQSQTMSFYLAYTGAVQIYANGVLIYSGSESLSEYQTIALSSAAVNALQVGSNELAVVITGDGTSCYFDTALTVSAGSSSDNSDAAVTQTLFTIGSEWTYYTSKTAEYSTSTSGSWTGSDFDTSSWKTGKTPFGNRIASQTTNWATSGNNYLWARKTFTVSDLSALGSSFSLYLNVFYDDTFYVYLNGHLIYSDGNWNDDYSDIKTTNGAAYLKEGTNVIAISLQQHTGGYEFDMGAYTVENLDNVQISLLDTNVLANRMKKYFPLSYLVLTCSTATANGSNWEWMASSTNKYTNWVSSMSQCEMLNPYAYGAHNSTLIKLLRNGHGNLTDEEIRAIACWIDLGVPCYGSYNANNAWGGNELREYEEELNKREFYDMMNDYAILSRAGLTQSGQITISYKPKVGSEVSSTGEGLVTLYTSVAYKNGDKLTFTLPEGEHYLAISLTSRVGESIVYCPDSTFSITLANLNTSYPNTMNPDKGVAYTSNTITARLVTDEELNTVHNLAQNSYDVSSATNVYPHATSSEIKSSTGAYSARNVIDGFTMNTNSGNYPYQSWEPASADASASLTIDFGRTVTISQLALVLRQKSTDSYFTDCKVTFSDGSSIVISLIQTTEEQVIDIDPVNTSSITLSDFTVETDVNGGSTIAITEVKAMGTELIGS